MSCNSSGATRGRRNLGEEGQARIEKERPTLRGENVCDRAASSSHATYQLQKSWPPGGCGRPTKLGLYPAGYIAVTQTKICQSVRIFTLNRSSHIHHGTDDLFPFIHPNIRFRVNNTAPLPVQAKSSLKPPKSKNKKRRRNQRAEHTNGYFTIDDSSRLPINDPVLSEG